LHKEKPGLLEMDFTDQRKMTVDLLDNIEQIHVLGEEDLLGKFLMK
jgi:hypothetical protein